MSNVYRRYLNAYCVIASCATHWMLLYCVRSIPLLVGCRHSGRSLRHNLGRCSQSQSIDVGDITISLTGFVIVCVIRADRHALLTAPGCSMQPSIASRERHKVNQSSPPPEAEKSMRCFL